MILLLRLHPGAILGKGVIHRGHQGLIAIGRIVLAQGVPDEVFVAKDAAQIGVAVKAHAKHVESLAFKPVGRTVGGCHRWQRATITDLGLDPQSSLIDVVRIVVDDIEAIGTVGVVDSAHVHQEWIVLFQFARHLEHRARVDDKGVLVGILRIGDILQARGRKPSGDVSP